MSDVISNVSLIEDYHLLSYETLDSTNEEAERLAEAGASHGAFIWSKHQTDGRGRLGREWVSKEGNLFVTVLLSPEKMMSEWAELSFVASLAVMEMLRPIVDAEHKLELKWPNDILLDGKKVAGILLETFQAQGRRWLAVGVGVNVDSFPKDVRYPATCLTESGVEIISAKIVLSRFIHHFIGRYDLWMLEGFQNVRDEWKSHAFRLGESVEMQQGDVLINGTFEDVDNSGQIVIVSPDGERHSLCSGDMKMQIV